LFDRFSHLIPDNSSYKEHQDLLWKAAMVELNKEKEQHKIDYHTTNMFPKSGEAPNEETWVAEMSEGIATLEKNNDSAANVEDEISEIDDSEQLKLNKLKTRKQRKKALRVKMEEKRKKFGKREKMKVQDVYKLKTMNKEIVAEENRIAQKIEQRQKKKKMKRSLPDSITGHKFEEPDVDLKLSEELTGSLKSLKPEGNLLTDRYKSMQKRNIIETRIKQKIVKNKRNRKLAEKRNYKMGFDWEKK
jgi:nucleolar protein 53